MHALVLSLPAHCESALQLHVYEREYSHCDEAGLHVTSMPPNVVDTHWFVHLAVAVVPDTDSGLYDATQPFSSDRFELTKHVPFVDDGQHCPNAQLVPVPHAKPALQAEFSAFTP